MTLRIVRVLARGCAAVFLLASPAAAVVQISSCPATCSSNCELNNDVDCQSGDRITLTNGADLNMNGNNINCVTGGGCSGSAVFVQNNGSQVDNSLAGTLEAFITGPFQGGVDCDGHTSTKVTGIEIASQRFGGDHGHEMR